MLNSQYYGKALPNIMLEGDMEQYLIDNEFNIWTEERLVDSTLVVERAIDMGYETYMMDGEGSFRGTLVFVKKNIQRTIKIKGVY